MDTRPVYVATTTPAVISGYDEAIERARALAPGIRARIKQADELRRLPDETVAELLESGLYDIMTPKRFGGSELGSEVMVDVTIELASTCAATGWVYMLWAAHMWMLALFDQRAQEEIWENPNSLSSSIVSTAGDIVPVDGGYHWTGRGFFSSGVDHCNWLTAAAPIKRDGEVAERRWLLLPREDLEIIDDWHTMGLRGTGSKTVVIADAFIPEYRTILSSDTDAGTAPGSALHPNPVYCGHSTANFTAAMAAPAIGVAKGFVQTFEDRLREKAAVGQGAVNSPYAEQGLMTTFGRFSAAAAQVDALHALTFQSAQRYGNVPAKDMSEPTRARLRRDQSFSAQMSRRVVNNLFEECGGTGLKESSDLQRIWRDANAAAAHHGLTWDWQAENWPKAVFAATDAP